MTSHNMRLQPKSFELIKQGIKDLELRIYDPKRRKVAQGDTLTFTNRENGESLKTKVIQLHIFESFAEMSQNVDPIRGGWKQVPTQEEFVTSMRKYYSAKEEKEYGVVAIEIA